MYLWITYTDDNGDERAWFLGRRATVKREFALMGMTLLDDNRVLRRGGVHVRSRGYRRGV